MMELIPAQIQDLPKVIEMQSAAGTSKFIMAYSEEQHKIEMSRPNVIYLSIINQNAISGFIILQLKTTLNMLNFDALLLIQKVKE